jgi:hypothetical protein
MSDIFISYASADRVVAHQLADALSSLGWSVWWDREIPLGRPFDQVIEEELNATRCVVVLWSKESVRSRWVKTEAGAAADRDRLIPVLIEDVQIPLEFSRIQTAMLQGWKGDRGSPGYAMLVSSIRKRLGEPAAPPAPPPRTQGPRTSAFPGHGQKIAIGVAAVLALLSVVMARTLLRASEPNPPEVAAAPSSEPASQTSASGEKAPSTVESAAAPAATTPAPTPVEGAFALKIGDTIKENVPGPGAGTIESPGAKDVYTFSAEPGQTVYFRKPKYDEGMGPIRWKLTDADGLELFSTNLTQEPGIQVLKKGGTYTLTVGSDQESPTGTYHVQVLNVPPPHRFAINIGDTIKENVPGPGAGTIESPGAKDIYTFSAEPRQTVYLRNLKHDEGMGPIRWKLTDADGLELFSTNLTQEPGVEVLRKGGTYTLTVGSDQESPTGTYHVQVLNVPPPHQFAINIGDTIKENVPGPGAGIIESPGVKDVYTFSARPGQAVHFHKPMHDEGMSYIALKLVDADGDEVFSTNLSQEPGVKVLRKGGTYTLTVGSDNRSETGAYSLQLSGVAK